MTLASLGARARGLRLERMKSSARFADGIFSVRLIDTGVDIVISRLAVILEIVEVPSSRGLTFPVLAKCRPNRETIP